VTLTADGRVGSSMIAAFTQQQSDKVSSQDFADELIASKR